MKTLPRLLALLSLFALCSLAEAQLAASNVHPVQRANSKLVDIDYDVTGTSSLVSVVLQISADGGSTWTVPATSLTGAIGSNVTPGTNLRITWNSGTDWNQQLSSQMKFRLSVTGVSVTGLVLIPAGSYIMGDALDGLSNTPTHTVTVSAFYMAQNLVTWSEYQTVKSWASKNGYSDLAAGSGKASTHPVQMVTWFDAIKYCNARSQQEGLTPCYYSGYPGNAMKTGTTAPAVNWLANGYRLPTEAEWEKAARGGLSGKRFPWGDTISQGQANYDAYSGYSYDLSGAVNNYHPTYATGGTPYTSPVGSFAANGYGLYDMAGNVWQWCWDWYGYYDTGSPTDPRGDSSGSSRVFRGGSWKEWAYFCRVAYRRYDYGSSGTGPLVGFRVARSTVGDSSTAIIDSSDVAVDTRDAVSITAQPVGVTVNQGASASFSVTAAGGGSYSYQWKKNGSSISNATGATLNLSNVQAADADSYTVVVTGLGSVTSNAASLLVISTASTLFSAAESALALTDAGLVNLSPIDKFTVVTAAASHSGSGNALKFQTVDNGVAYAERTIVGPAVVNFWWRVSSEEGADFFSYSVDGTIQQSISGNGSWANRSLVLGAGTHTLRWTYAKDVDSANFDDAGYLDDLVILPAYTDLQVSRLGTVLSGSSTLDFGTVQQNAAEVTQELDLKNNGTAPMEVAASLPDGCGFVFDTDEASIVFTLGAGEETIVSLKLQTAVAGAKSALLAIEGTDSQTAAPAITLSGNVQAIAPILGCSWSGGALTNGQNTAVDFGATPSDLVFTISNTGQAALTITSASVLPATDFQVIAQPSASVAVDGSTTFTLRALEGSRGSHSATVTIVSNDGSAPSFSFPVTSESYLAATGTSFVSGSFTNTGTSAGWSNAAVTLASGSSGQALKTGTTPDNGNSTIGATFDGPGLLSWNWQVSSQANYDWLLCEVNGVEVAGISTKTAAWQSQVVQIPAGAQVRWIYRKDGSNFSGSDTGYLSDIYFSKFTAPQISFQDWSAANGNLSPTQLIPAGGIQAMYAWLCGIDPAKWPGAGLFKLTVSGGRYKYRCTIAKAAAGLIQPQISTDLVNWNSRKLSQTIISEDDTSAVVELSVPAWGMVFGRMATDLPAYAVPAPAGFVLVAAGALPSSSEMGAQSVAAFYMAQTETTWGQWQTVRTWAAAHGYDLADEGAGNGDSFPVTDVNWYHVVKWCNARSEMEGLTPVYTVNGSTYRTGDSAPVVNANANGYRLPGEAEWEFAARGGVNTHGYEYSGSDDLNAVAWFGDNSGYTTQSVATKQANELGLSDMSGNVWEWCYDWHRSFRVLRGGSWNNDAYYCRVAYRFSNDPSNSDPFNGFGFRVARSSVPQ